jgi:hypothetical protein
MAKKKAVTKKASVKKVRTAKESVKKTDRKGNSKGSSKKASKGKKSGIIPLVATYKGKPFPPQSYAHIQVKSATRTDAGTKRKIEVVLSGQGGAKPRDFNYLPAEYKSADGKVYNYTITSIPIDNDNTDSLWIEVDLTNPIGQGNNPVSSGDDELVITFVTSKSFKTTP